eukprot:16439011-Heterocapsa_arctica.AAC.1
MMLPHELFSAMCHHYPGAFRDKLVWVRLEPCKFLAGRAGNTPVTIPSRSWSSRLHGEVRAHQLPWR